MLNIYRKQDQQDPAPEGPEVRRTTETPDRGKLPRPPLHTFIFWIVALFAIPVILFFYKIGSQETVTELDASQFEEYLISDRILSASVITDPASGVRTITGEFQQQVAGAPQEPSVSTVERKKYKVEVIYTDALESLLREHCPEREFKTLSSFWNNILFSLLPILVLVAVIYFLFSRQLKAAGRGALQFGKSRARLMTPKQERLTFDDVSGIDEAKEEVQEIIDYLKDPQKFQRLGGRIPKGVLMIGPPGTGKTLLARAIAGEADVPFFSISGSDFVEMFVGVGASRVRDMFEEGKRHSPCLIFIDEIDAVGRSRFSGIGGGHDEREQTLNALLVEMDGFEANSGVIVIAATNRPDVLDAALLRPGRFDRQITIDLPDVRGRLGILNVHARKVTLGTDVELEVIAKGTPGYSGADLANLINEAALLAARQNKNAIDMEDLEEARDKVRWGRERRSRTINEKDRRITAFHEAGHALAGLLCEHSTPLHKVTIVPRGTAYLGATMHLPEHDRYTRSTKELKDELVVLMGGRVAEELIFDDLTSGASMDIRQATQLARKMVCEWGMSARMGALSYSTKEEPVFLGRDINRGEIHSEQTSREIDEEVRTIIDTAEAHTRDLLTQNLDRLKLLGETLLERETMSAREIRELLGFPVPAIEIEIEPELVADPETGGTRIVGEPESKRRKSQDAPASADKNDKGKPVDEPQA